MPGNTGAVMDPVVPPPAQCEGPTCAPPPPCRQFQAIAPSPNGVITVPERTQDGMCYTMKLMDEIPASRSELSPSVDTKWFRVIIRSRLTTPIKFAIPS